MSYADKLPVEAAQQIVEVVTSFVPKSASADDITNIHLAAIWRLVFATMAVTMDARVIRGVVDDAVREAIRFNGAK